MIFAEGGDGMLRSFAHGVHLNDNKHWAENAAIRDVEPGEVLAYPLAQHIGSPASPAVSEGDRVLVGQTIAHATSAISADIVCAVSGTVKRVGAFLGVRGETVDAVVVENDGLFETVEGYGQKRDYTQLSPNEIREIVRAAGIVGLGGAGFPTNVKLNPKQPEAIDTIIANGVECEPYLTTDYRLMLEQPEKLIRGLHIVLSLFPNARAVIAIEKNKPEAIRLLSERVANEPRISVAALKTKYPEGDERMLIHAVTGRDIHAGQLPAEVGCLVNNIATVVAIDEAVCDGLPLTHRVITVTGDAVNEPCNLRVACGDLYSHVVEAAGGFNCEPQKVISGGPMMGISLFSLDIPVVKTSSCILALAEDEVSHNTTTACIHCGRCLRACPELLVPRSMHAAAEAEDFDRFIALNGMECIECGSCTYVCPAKIPLTQSFQYARRRTKAILRIRALQESEGKA